MEKKMRPYNGSINPRDHAHAEYKASILEHLRSEPRAERVKAKPRTEQPPANNKWAAAAKKLKTTKKDARQKKGTKAKVTTQETQEKTTTDATKFPSSYGSVMRTLYLFDPEFGHAGEPKPETRNENGVDASL
ncbi:uncharacterized protein LOC101849847 isoform X1 [Aplysia californica]|uniref:Uncharacterized protein LOC101849847 isoform X1 n=1 Tax=Aplysia californica TaxID=6500 RepID=A0ABM0JR79_APLCA|nr:uncharacterized protein LOC101849847 isoform X1 [Aplysia californica]XP_035825987.1 uncharacterized protein LOC101849847 isoform X1 [Aplysia californica]